MDLWDDSIEPWADLESQIAFQPQPSAELEAGQNEDEPIPQPEDFFYEEARVSPGLPVGGPEYGYTSVCRYIRGHHIAGPDCPHFEPEDEFGRVIPDGWTVQNGY